MHARIISERDFQTIHLKIITPKMAILGVPRQGWQIHSILPIHTCIYSYLYKYLYNTCILYQLDITDCAYMQNSALYGALHTCMMRAIIVYLYCIFSQLSHTCI